MHTILRVSSLRGGTTYNRKLQQYATLCYNTGIYLSESNDGPIS